MADGEADSSSSSSSVGPAPAKRVPAAEVSWPSSLRGLLAVYSCVSPSRLDLLHDQGESEVFVVDGEALLSEYLSSPRTATRPAETAGAALPWQAPFHLQPLHLAYNVESLLSKLQGVGGYFQVAFSHEVGRAWGHGGNPALPALRALLITHLRRCGIPTSIFPSYFDPSFQQYLAGLHPTFILSSDNFISDLLAAHGAARLCRNPRGTHPRPGADAAAAAAASDPMSLIGDPEADTCIVPGPVRCLAIGAVLHWGLLGHAVAYMANLEFDAVTVHGFLTPPERVVGPVKDSISNFHVSITSARVAAAACEDMVGLEGWRSDSGCGVSKEGNGRDGNSGSDKDKGDGGSNSDAVDADGDAGSNLLIASLCQAWADATSEDTTGSHLDIGVRVITTAWACAELLQQAWAAEGGGGACIAAGQGHGDISSVLRLVDAALLATALMPYLPLEARCLTPPSAEASRHDTAGGPWCGPSEMRLGGEGVGADGTAGEASQDLAIFASRLALHISRATVVVTKRAPAAGLAWLATSSGGNANVSLAPIGSLQQRLQQMWKAEMVDAMDSRLLQCVATLLLSTAATRLRSQDRDAEVDGAVGGGGNVATAVSARLDLPAHVEQRWSAGHQLFGSFLTASAPAGSAAGTTPAVWNPHDLESIFELMQRRVGRQQLETLMLVPGSRLVDPQGPQGLSVARGVGKPAAAFATLANAPLDPSGANPFLQRVLGAVGSGELSAVLQQRHCPDGRAGVPQFAGVPYEERYHWHVRRDLDPAAWTETEDHLKQRRALIMCAPVEDLPSIVGRVPSKKLWFQLQNAVNSNLAGLGKELALNILADKESISKQRESRAMERMAASLAGTKFYASGCNNIVAASDSKHNGNTKPQEQHDKSHKLKPVSNADRIRADADKERQAKAVEADRQRWQGRDDKPEALLADLGGKPGAAELHKALQAVEKFCSYEKCTQKMKLYGMGVQLQVHYAILRALLRSRDVAAIPEAAPPPLPGGIAAAQALPPATASTVAVKTIRSTLLLLQQLKKEASEAASFGSVMVQLLPCATSSSKYGKEVAVVEVAGACLAALGCADAAARLRDELGGRLTAEHGEGRSGADTGGGHGGRKFGNKAKPAKGTKDAGPKGETRLSAPAKTEASKGLVLKGLDVSRLLRDTGPAAAAAAALQPPRNFSLPRFQLRHMAHMLERPVVAGGRDPRVTGFVPDDWQRKLLDIVDNGSSAVVSAPTSSGKTFIASYVIEKVLRSGGDGIVVIVLPTKALVNQLAAQVYVDFGHATSGDVCGVFTRDWRRNVDNCRVLITVPACLEILVLTPSSKRRSWLDRIKYAIFDEVHCINEQGAGATWELLLLAMRCPLLALSATIANPVQFTAWLQHVKALQRQQDAAMSMDAGESAYVVSLVEHKERYNDLQMHVYLPPDDRGPAGPVWTEPEAPLDGAEAGFGDLQELHPIASLTPQAIAASGSLPADLSFTSDEVLLLYDHMAAAIGEEIAAQHPGAAPESMLHAADGSVTGSNSNAQSPLLPTAAQAALSCLLRLSPDVYFSPTQGAAGPNGGSSQVTRPGSKRWQADVKAELLRWATSEDEVLQAALRRVWQGLVEPTEGVWRQTEQRWRAQSRNGGMSKMRHVTSLLLAMSRRGMLPSIIFSLSRSEIEHYVSAVSQDLLNHQAEYRRRYDAELKPYYAKYAQEQSMREAAAWASRNQPDGAGSSSLPDGPDASAPAGSFPFVTIKRIAFSKNPNRSDPSFTFLPPRLGFGDPVLEAQIEDLEQHGFNNKALLDGLRLGIGAHHAGLDKQYRQAVEILFRGRHLQVVFATGTLAYGIHMPCRAIVIASDSVQLDALNFRQMSGRAGRRGLDPVGHVIFFGVPLHSVHKLRTAPIARLRGQPLLSPTLTLRLMLLSQQAAAVVPSSAHTSASPSAAPRQSGRQQPARRADNSPSPSQPAGAPVVVRDDAADLLVRIIQQPFLAHTARSRADGNDGRRDIAPATSILAGTAAVGVPMQLHRTGQQMLHLLGFSLDHLSANHLIDGASGQLQGLAGMVTHLFWAEPANFALARLLGHGVFHSLLARHRSLDDCMRNTLLIVAHLFERMPMHVGQALSMSDAAKGKSGSVVVLPPLPDDAAAVLRTYNDQVLSALMSCITTYAASLAQEDPTGHHLQECTLPLSGLLCGGTALSTADAALPVDRGSSDRVVATTVADGAALGLCAQLDRCRVPYQACSPFVALSGHGDAFFSVADVVESCKQAISLQASSVPAVQLTNRHGLVVPLNAYALDFFKHGSMMDIVQSNRVREGDAWEAMKTIIGILSAIAVSLEQATADASATSTSNGSSADDGDAGSAHAGGHNVAAVQAADVAATFTALRDEFRRQFRRIKAEGGYHSNWTI